MYKIITKKEYQPKYNLNKIEPFTYVATKNGHTNMIDFKRLVEKNDIGKIAYWFDQKNKKNKDFLYSYDGLKPYTYSYDEFFSNALDTAMLKNNTDVIEFLLFDDLNKEAGKLKKSSFLKEYDQDYSEASSEYMMFLSKHGIIGGMYFEHEIFENKKERFEFLTELIPYAVENDKPYIIENLKNTANSKNTDKNLSIDIKSIKNELDLILKTIKMHNKMEKNLPKKNDLNSNQSVIKI